MKNYKNFGKSLLRRKHIDNSGQTILDRCLNTFDLTALGIGSTLGLGIYVLAGQVASKKAGPSVTISFLIAAIASVFAGLCYAEFGARVPRAGSAYIYSYVTVGEFLAFVIGWNLVLEYVIGTASVARGYSGYIDSLTNETIKNFFREWMPMNINGISEYPDFLAFGITILLTIMLAIGVKESTKFNSIFTGLNLLVVIYVVVCGSFKLDFHNWNLDKSEVSDEGGKGGFMPFGFSGMMAGAATCFYGFVGFDVIATAGEEVRNPQKAIPISIVTSLLFIFLAYFGVSAVQTLMWPYYDQNRDAPLPYVFKAVGYDVASWVITIGALAGLSTSLLGAMFPLPRVLYAMATDGIIFRILAEVHPRSKTPLLATIVSGLFAGAMATMFNVSELADMMSIGTLLAYSLVAVSVLILRFSHNVNFNINSGTSNLESTEIEPLSTSHVDARFKEEDGDFSGNSSSNCENSMSKTNVHYTWNEIRRQIFNSTSLESPNALSTKLSVALVITICMVLIILDSFLVFLEDNIFNGDLYVILLVLITLGCLITCIVALNAQPRSTSEMSFKVPMVPITPILSIFVNFYLMLKLSTLTWIRFGVWMTIGFVIYFGYGIRNSTGYLSDDDKRKRLNKLDQQEVSPVNIEEQQLLI